MDHNRVHLVGRLVRDPEYFPPGQRGQEHCVFTIAVNRVVPTAEGPAADYIPCSLWGEKAQLFVQTMHKGDEVCCLGRIRTNLIPQADGSREHFWEIRVDRVEFGRMSLKNLRAVPQEETSTIRAVRKLHQKFGESHE